MIEADSVMVRYQDRGPDSSSWHEVKLGSVGGWTGARPAAHPEAPSYVAAREQAAPFARRLGAEVARRGAVNIVGWRGHDADAGGHEAILRPVVVHQTPAPNADALKVLQRERGYFTANALRMPYPVFRKRGLPVGSGAMEGGAKTYGPTMDEAGQYALERNLAPARSFTCAATA
jgi:hypothetical protein